MIYWDWNHDNVWEGFYGREPMGSVVGYWIGAGVEFYAYTPSGDKIGDGKPFPTLAEAKAEAKADFEHDVATRRGASRSEATKPNEPNEDEL